MSLANLISSRIHSAPEWTRRPEVLLQNNTVKPLHKVVPRTILGKQWWDETRERAYAATDYHCIACGVPKSSAKWHKWLEGHEVYTIDYKNGRMTYIETVALCHFCHCFIHDGRLKAMLDRKEINQDKYDAVMAHGKLVLKEAGLRKESNLGRQVAPWSEWRLVLFGQEYPPIFKDYNEWLIGHGYLEEED